MMKIGAAEVCLEKPQAARIPVAEFLSMWLEALARRRCQLIHTSISRPVNGRYRCWTCYREFDTNW